MDAIRNRQTWFHVVSDIHQVKPPMYPVDLPSMSANELRTMAIRAYKLHQVFSGSFEFDRYEEMCFGGPFPIFSYCNGRYLGSDSQNIHLLDLENGLLDTIPALVFDRTEDLECIPKIIPIVISPSQGYLFQYVNCEGFTYVSYRL